MIRFWNQFWFCSDSILIKYNNYFSFKKSILFSINPIILGSGWMTTCSTGKDMTDCKAWIVLQKLTLFLGVSFIFLMHQNHPISEMITWCIIRRSFSSCTTIICLLHMWLALFHFWILVSSRIFNSCPSLSIVETHY